jgi:glutamate racemase
MHILITDSGVGGLSVVAYAERFVHTHGFTEPVRLTFANAAPENDYGYNSMPTREEKLQTFDRFLRNVTERFAPDSIYVACNTLSVLLPDTPYAAEAGTIPVTGIVETGVALLVKELEADPRSAAVIFGTQTTIDAGTYPRLLQERGIAPERIVSQACPGLADTISEDREGTRTRAEIRRWVDTAIAKMNDASAPVVACLACTHYGYRREHFAAAFAEAGVAATVVNPNESAVDDLFGEATGEHHQVEVEFVTRYAIPPVTIDALTFFLDEISPRTVAAMRQFVHLPDLF